MNVAAFFFIIVKARATSVMPLTSAGSLLAPISKKSLYITGYFPTQRWSFTPHRAIGALFYLLGDLLR
jgi:hypothetical protein